MKKPTAPAVAITADYRQFIEELKARVAGARISAARRVNHELILLYWDIGRGIVEKQQALGWGESVVEMVAADLRHAFPSMSGFSPRNVWYMRRLYEAISAPEFLAHVMREMSKRGPSPILQQPVAELETSRIWLQPAAKLGAGCDPGPFLQQLVAEIPWGQHITITEKVTAPAARLWYLRATARFGWSRNVLLNQIKAGAYERAGTEKKTHNFAGALPEHFVEQADEMLKSSYNLEFLGLRRTGPKARSYASLGQRPRCSITRKPRAVSPLQLRWCPAGVGRAYSPRSSLTRSPGALPQAGIVCAFGAREIGLPGELKGKLPTAKQLADILRVEMEGGK